MDDGSVPRRGIARVLGLVACVALLAGVVAAAALRPSGDHAAGHADAADGRLVAAAQTFAQGRVLDVYRPYAGPPRPSAELPVVVMVSGCCGDRADLGKIAEATATAGALVLVADWAGLTPDTPWQGGYEDVACAVRFARARAGSLGGDPGRVVLLGWADGAMPASVIALAGDRFDAGRCSEPFAPPLPDAVVGVAGFYGWELPVPARYVTTRGTRILRGTPETAAASWRDATPYAWLERAGPRCWRLLVGASDPLLEDARRFDAALRLAGHVTRLVVAPPAGDSTMISPRTLEGRRTVAEAIAAAHC